MPISRLATVFVFLFGLLPLGRLFYLGFNDDLSANPLEFVTRSTGTWTLIFLCITLAITPARHLLQRLPQVARLWQATSTWLLLRRRMMGLYVFFYATLHFALWIWLENDFDTQAMWVDFFKRPFIFFGIIAFMLLLPLAITSNRWAIKLLKRSWKPLHWLIYLIALLAIAHYLWHKMGKNDFLEVSVYATIITLLLGWRVFQRFIGRTANSKRP